MRVTLSERVAGANGHPVREGAGAPNCRSAGSRCARACCACSRSGGGSRCARACCACAGCACAGSGSARRNAAARAHVMWLPHPSPLQLCFCIVILTLVFEDSITSTALSSNSSMTTLIMSSWNRTNTTNMSFKCQAGLTPLSSSLSTPPCTSASHGSKGVGKTAA